MRLWAGQDDPHPPAGRGSGLVVVYGVQPAGPPVWPGVRLYRQDQEAFRRLGSQDRFMRAWRIRCRWRETILQWSGVKDGPNEL